MISLLLIIASISGGILLALATLDKWDGERNIFNNIAGKLALFQTIIGGALIILAILTFKSSFLLSIVRILGGLLLLTHVFGKVPALETSLRKLSAMLMPFKAIIGIALIVIGILAIFLNDLNPAEVYILKQPEPYKSILLHLQVLIEHTLPEADLLYKWRLPCYYIGKRPVCYINQAKDYIDVGFWHSAHLSKKWDDYLIVEKRKVVKSLRYKSLEDINDEIFIAILKEVEFLKDKGFYKRS